MIFMKSDFMENLIVILKNGEILYSAGYTPALKRLDEEHKLDKMINISNPTEPRILDKELGQWIKLKGVW